MKSPLRLEFVHQGEYAASSDPEVTLQTVLGSCVATCIYDPDAGVGGMNHFLLPEGGSSDTRERLYGVNLMELLINDLMRRGADRKNLKAKLFGGASMFGQLSDIGARNAAFARGFLADEGIPCVAESLGGKQGRRVRFRPVGGQARQNLVTNVETPAPTPPPAPKPEPTAEIDLF